MATSDVVVRGREGLLNWHLVNVWFSVDRAEKPLRISKLLGLVTSSVIL